MMKLRTSDVDESCRRSLVVLACCGLFALFGAEPIAPSAAAQERPRRVTPPPPLSPRELLDQARGAVSQVERIDLLDKFLTAQRGSELEGEAREALMREYALRGEQHLREADPQAALRDFKALLRVAPREITDRIFGQYLFPMPVAMSTFGYRAESVELARVFETRFAGDTNRLVQIGFFYVQIEAPLEAVRLLEKVVKLAPGDHRAHNSLGTAYLINLRLDDAQAEFELAIGLDPRDEYANLNLANLLRAAGDRERAEAYYRKQLGVKPDDAEALGGLSIVLLGLGRDEEAEQAAARSIQLAPQDYRFLTQLAYFYATRRKGVQARPLIERALTIEPRYAWAHITKANIDLLEQKYGDALSTLIQAQSLGTFATLRFELVKALMGVDGYDQAIEALSKSFTVTDAGEFEATLGGVFKSRSPKLDLLLERERRASLFFNDPLTTSLQFRLAEALARINKFARAAALRKPAARAASPARKRATAARGSAEPGLKTASRPRRARGESPSPEAELTAGRDAGIPGVAELMRAITIFCTLDDGRQAFRMVWVARKLTEMGLALDAAEQLSRRAIAAAESATEPEGSMRDAPLLNREGRRAVFLGRAYDALGWTLFKKGDTRGAIGNLTKSVESYLPSAERKAAIWHLAVATEDAGDERHALELYIASYTSDTAAATVRRAQIESLYKKLNGSLAGLEEKLRGQ